MVCVPTNSIGASNGYLHFGESGTEKDGVEMLFREAAYRPQSSTLITIVKGPIWVRYTIWGEIQVMELVLLHPIWDESPLEPLRYIMVSLDG